jgi:lipoprotein-releasing system permease protein/zinc transport system substrate-binding protein
VNLSFSIAARYLFSKKTHNAINVVSMISVFGVTVAVAALICTLSVYNGFQQLLGGLYSNFDPQIKIKIAEGKVFNPETSEFGMIKNSKYVDVFCESLEENALLIYKDAQTSAIVKGVPDNYNQLTSIEKLITAGDFKLREYDFDYATLGIGLATSLGTGSSFIDPITIDVPLRTKKINLANPSSSFKTSRILVGGSFSLNQPEYDNNYVIVPLAYARELFEYDKEVTSIEIKLKKDVRTETAIKEFKKILGDKYTVHSIMEQKADFYKINRIEKWMTYLILSFILIIALFNVVGSLSMLIIEKKNDTVTLSNLGADRKLISRIFLTEGLLISFSGAILGLIIGALLCLLQQQFGLLKLGGGGNYIVDAYPVNIQLRDVIIIFITTMVVSIPASWWPVNIYFKKKNSPDHVEKQ